MKLKFKKYLQFAMLFLTVALFTNCEKEEDVFIEKQHEEIALQSTLYAKDVPHIIDYLKKETNGSFRVKVENKKITKSTETQAYSKVEQTPLGYINTNQVLRLRNDVTNTNKYTFEVIDNDLETFINLIIIEEPQNEIKSYFIKYIPNETWHNTKDRDLKNFSGSVEIYSYSGNLINTYTLNNGLVSAVSSRGNPCADNTTNPNGDSNDDTNTIPVVDTGLDTGYSPWNPWVYVPFGGDSSGDSEEISEDEEEEDGGGNSNGSQTGHCDGPRGDGECYCHMLGNRMAQIDLQTTIATPTTTEPQGTYEDCTNVGVLNISPIYQLDLTQGQIDWITHADNFEVYQLVSNFLIINSDDEELAEEIINAAIEGTLITIAPFFKYPDGSTYAIDYPELTILLKEYIPYLKNNTRLIDTISNLTGLSDEEIKEDFTWGEGPEIHIEQLGVVNGQEIKGRFNPLEPNKIVIDVDLVNALEALAAIENPTTEQTQQLQLFDGLVTFAVCLHEYVHFADNAFDGTMQDNEELELGLLFEELFVGGYYEVDPNGNIVLIPIN
ncbi:hypothetical protein [uncultured Lacinutrix sp.]|uniref:hypothetical protein n=1 Tax=uncultured Lacinutrix sp. TaxID=574032 RepID=UPI0026244D9D|nr:hypothetical protein [uncultured Lacinutrix sp.]